MGEAGPLVEDREVRLLVLERGDDLLERGGRDQLDPAVGEAAEQALVAGGYKHFHRGRRLLMRLSEHVIVGGARRSRHVTGAVS